MIHGEYFFAKTARTLEQPSKIQPQEDQLKNSQEHTIKFLLFFVYVSAFCSSCVDIFGNIVQYIKQAMPGIPKGHMERAGMHVLHEKLKLHLLSYFS